MMNPGQAQSAGLGNLVAQRSSIPNDQFVRSATEFVEKTGASPIDMLADTYRRVMAAKNAMMRQGLAAGRAEAQQPRTVAEQLNQEALALGIGSQPYGYAGGGLVAFTGGGKVEEPLTAADIDAEGLDNQMAFGVGPEFGNSTLEATVEDALRVEAQPALNAAAYPPDAQELARQGRLIGIVVSPYDSAQARAEKFQRIRAAVAAAKERESQPRAEIPTVESDALQRAFSPAGQAQRVTEGAARPSASAPAAAAGTGTGTGTRSIAGTARTSPPAATPAASDNIAQYTAAAEAAMQGAQGRGVPSPEVLELRKAMLAAQEAEREPRMEYKEPEGLTARELLQLASFDPTKGKWMGSLAEKAAGVVGAREAKAEEVKKLNREIDIANRRLNTALAQQRLAYATGDQKTKEDADQAVLNARVALREKVIQFGFEAEKLEVQRRQAGAAERQAGAAETAAKLRGEKPEITPAVKAQLLREAEKSVGEDPALLVQLNRTPSGSQREQLRQQFIEQRYQALLATFQGTTSPAPVSSPGGVTLTPEQRALIDKYK